MSIATELTRIQGAKANLKTAIENKGVTVSSSALIDEYPALVDSIPTGGGGYEIETIINDDGTQEVHIVDAGGALKMMDFDGTILYSFTREEVMEMTELPDPPDHSDNEVPLTFDGWNWTLESIKEQLDEIGGEVLVGATYHPTDGMTHIFVEVDDDDLWGVQMSGSGTVYWGDGTSSTDYSKAHIYSKGGEYEITYDGSIQGIGSSSSNYRRYINKYRRIYYSKDQTGFNGFAHYNCYALQRVVIPNGSITTLLLSDFSNCTSLRNIIIPNGVTSLGSATFNSCSSLCKISIPNSVSSIDGTVFTIVSLYRLLLFRKKSFLLVLLLLKAVRH